MKRLLITLITLALLTLSLGAGTPSPSKTNASPPKTDVMAPNQPQAGAYVLLAWGELGMHCIDGKDYSVFSVLPPFNVIHAQLFKRGEPPVPITTGVTITYQATPDTTGSINTYSAKKTNFWNYVQKLFLQSPPPETGLAGYKTQSKTPQQMAYNATEGYWEAVGIPTVDYDDLKKFNPLPMAKLVAKDTAGNVLATAKIVLAVSEEMSCNQCHA